MNINPKALTILCFGDSNAYGQKPDRSGRYALDIRWTGRLQDLLGEGYYIIEEGLGSRTTYLDYSKPGRNGKTYLHPCIESHNPIDIILVMLGTNDLKMEFGRSASTIAQAIKGLVDDINQYAKNKNGVQPKIVLISPIHIHDTAPRFAELYTDYYNHQSAITSTELADTIKVVADQTQSHFVDASTVAAPGEDGIHLSKEAHLALGELLAHEIKKL